MKPLNLVLLIVLILLLAFVALFFAGGTLSAQVSSSAAAAADHAQAFESIRGLLTADAVPQRFSDETPNDPAAYSLVEIRVSLVNRGIFAAEWLNPSLEGADGDLALYSLSGDGTDVSARGRGELNLKLITRAPADATRRLRLQYYVYGVSRTITIDL